MPLKDVEALIDEKYSRIPLPHPNRCLSAWNFLVATEDAIRMMLLRDHTSSGEIEYFVDRAKYSLKHGLSRITTESKDIKFAEVPRRINEHCYERGFDLLTAGLDYSLGCQICSSAHNGTVELSESNGLITLKIDEKYHTKEYAVLEMMGHQPEDSTSFMQVIFWLINNEDKIPLIVSQIAETVSVKGKLLSYDYNSSLAEALCFLFSQPPLLIPEDWQFAWGGRRETTLLLNALSMRCAYHFLAVHFGARAKKLVGGGCSDLVLVTSIGALCHDLEELSSLPLSEIRKFVTMLTYGAGAVKSPDPALQPLFPLAKDIIAISPLHILSCHMERNLLVLYARTQSSRFDAMSSAFERDMISSIVRKISPHWENIKPNYTWRFGDHKEEFDLLIADPESRHICACEMRWTLQPGEPREVAQRKEYCFEKVTQLSRKIEWLRPNLAHAVSKIFGFAMTDETPWTVSGLVVVEGFGGVMSPDENIPILPTRFFERAIERISSLQEFSNWCTSLAWLPQEGTYFEMHQRKMALSGKTLFYEGMAVIQDRSQYLKYLDETLILAEIRP